MDDYHKPGSRGHRERIRYALPTCRGVPRVRKVIGGYVRGIEAVQVGYAEDLGAANSRQVYVDALRDAHSVVECISIVQVSGRVRPDGSGPGGQTCARSAGASQLSDLDGVAQ